MVATLPIQPTMTRATGLLIVVGQKNKPPTDDDRVGMLNSIENFTYGIDLSKDWTNSTLSLVQTTRPSDAAALSSESLWFDEKRNSIYCFGGLKSYATTALRRLSPPIESIWGFKQNDEGSAVWYQVIGPVSKTPFPPNIRRIARGISASDGNRAYYLGGFQSRRQAHHFLLSPLMAGPHPPDC